MNDETKRPSDKSRSTNIDEPIVTAETVTEEREGETNDSWTHALRPLLGPGLFLAAGLVLFIILGIAQKVGLISAGEGSSQTAAADENTRYICPMMCTPPSTEPGRCPICGMELVPATSSGADLDELAVRISPAARRLSNITTAVAKREPVKRKITTIGALSYDEGRMATIAAYVDGRIERIHADYTGFFVPKGYHMAVLYSPKLFAAQEEFLQSKKAIDRAGENDTSSFLTTQRRLLAGSRQKLTELGMTGDQIDELAKSGEANSRVQVSAPIEGTVIQKLAVEGQYIKEGEPIYQIADLTNIWLMLDLFPEDASAIRYGQRVEAEVQSLPGHKFTGRVAFTSPYVNERTRTVSVRVVIPNKDGVLRVGDYARATIEIDIVPDADPSEVKTFDPDLAGKFISPHHPEVVEDKPGKCRVCGVDLIPVSKLGFAEKPIEGHAALVIPRDAVLMAGNNSVVYVETETGRFEIRAVTLGRIAGDKAVILDGIEEGEQVAVSGNFLIDSQMQLAGNPSLIDTSRLKPRTKDDSKSPKVIAALAKLSDEDRKLAEQQKICPVTKQPLGSMGKPPKVDVNGRPVFICCAGCESRLLKEPDKYLANIKPPHDNAEAKKIAAALAKLSDKDRALAEKQKMCPVSDEPLGSMGTPKKVDVNGRPVFICCEGCREALLEDPKQYLDKLSKESAK